MPYRAQYRMPALLFPGPWSFTAQGLILELSMRSVTMLKGLEVPHFLSSKLYRVFGIHVLRMFRSQASWLLRLLLKSVSDKVRLF